MITLFLIHKYPKLLHISDKLAAQDAKLSYLNAIVIKTMGVPSRKVSQKELNILSIYLCSIERSCLFIRNSSKTYPK